MGCLYLTSWLSAEVLLTPEETPYFSRISVLWGLYLSGSGHRILCPVYCRETGYKRDDHVAKKRRTVQRAANTYLEFEEDTDYMVIMYINISFKARDFLI